MSSSGTKELQELYNTDATAKALLDHFATRQRERKETTVDSLITHLSAGGYTTSREDLIRVLQRLEQVKIGGEAIGLFRIGRRGMRTRMIWNTDIRSLGMAAKGQAVEFNKPEFIEHTAKVRGQEVTFRLPKDLNPTEAVELAQFVEAIPV